jgi:hypothetical protein
MRKAVPGAAEMIAQATGRIIALLVCEPFRSTEAARWHLLVVEAGLMATTRIFIPTDSSYEREVFDALLKAGRRFLKPLRYRGEDTHPDALLLDTPRPVPMEIWGFTGEAYARRRYEKTARYNAEYGSGGWWGWCPLEGPMPEFPPAAPLAP